MAPAALSPACVDALLQRSAARNPEAAVPPALAALSGGFFSPAFAYAACLFWGLVLLATVGVFIFYPRARALQAIKGSDAFGLRAPLVNGAVPVMLKTEAGGACTAFAHGVLFLLAVFYAVSFFSLENVAVVPSLRVLHDGTLTTIAGEGTVWLQAPPLALTATSAAAGSVGFSGLQVRVLAMGEPGRCAQPLNWSSQNGLTTGVW